MDILKYYLTGLTVSWFIRQEVKNAFRKEIEKREEESLPEVVKRMQQKKFDVNK